MTITGELVSYESRRTYPKLKGIVVDEDVLGDLESEMGWNRRSKQGETLRRNTVDLFIDDMKNGLSKEIVETGTR